MKPPHKSRNELRRFVHPSGGTPKTLPLCKPGITCEQPGSPISNIQNILLPPKGVGGMAEATQFIQSEEGMPRYGPCPIALKPYLLAAAKHPLHKLVSKVRT